jgi:hypothetical protein
VSCAVCDTPTPTRLLVLVCAFAFESLVSGRPHVAWRMATMAANYHRANAEQKAKPQNVGRDALRSARKGPLPLSKEDLEQIINTSIINLLYRLQALLFLYSDPPGGA